MMSRFATIAAISAALTCLGGVSTLAQDPLTTLPQSYKLELENDYVKVVRVHYDAGAKLADHTHPGGTTIYVYLNDSEGVTFQHSSGSGRGVTRPPVQAGGIRIASGSEEHHSVENKSSIATDFLRIYLKTDSGGARSTRRMPPTEMEFANKQVRITRVNLKAADKVQIEATDNPVLRIPITLGMKEWKALPSSNALWLEPGQREAYTTIGPADDTQIIRIEFLTRPK